MNFKLTTALVIVMLGLLLAYKFWPAPPVDKTKSLQTGTAMISPSPAEITAISFKRRDKEQLAFVKTDNKWSMTFPVKAPAETYAVERITDVIDHELTYKEKFEPEATGLRTAEATGTGSPRYSLSFTDKDGKQHTVALGKTTGAGGIYATLDGGKTIYLLEHDPLDVLGRNPEDFRAKNIKDIPNDRVTALKITRGKDTVSLVKNGELDTNWLINAPISARANASVVTEILKQIQSINATGFSDMTRDMLATGLNPPIVSVTAFVSEKPAKPVTAAATGPASTPAVTAVTLDLGYFTDPTNKKNVYACISGSDQVFTLNADALTKLNRELNDLRDPSITPAAVSQATEITLTSVGKSTLKVIKKDGKWSIPASTGGAIAVPVGDLEVGDFLGDIGHLRAIKYVDNVGDLKSIGLDPPQAMIDMAVSHQSQHEVILIGKSETDVTGGKVTPMMRQGEATVYLVPSAEVEKLQATPLTLRDKNLDNLMADHVHAIAIAGPAAGASAGTIERAGGAWVVKVSGKAEKTDDEKMTGLLADFTPLTAVKFLSESADVSGNPDVTVTFSVTEFAKAATTGPATTSAPASGPAPAAIGPEMGKEVKHTLKLYKATKDGQTSWKAVWDGASPQWMFEPTEDLVLHVTKTTYAVPSTQPASQPATQSASQPATVPAK